MTDIHQFLPEFINDGIVGGTRVAHRVYGAARNIISSEDDDSTELIIRVYANVTGLENALRINGCYSESRSLRDFTNGFTQAENQTSFIDVGAGKEAVDEKLRSESFCDDNHRPSVHEFQASSIGT